MVITLLAFMICFGFGLGDSLLSLRIIARSLSGEPCADLEAKRVSLWIVYPVWGACAVLWCLGHAQAGS
jgi:hypothetical protein